eukprot:scpid15547/ scgid1724/ 
MNLDQDQARNIVSAFSEEHMARGRSSGDVNTLNITHAYIRKTMACQCAEQHDDECVKECRDGRRIVVFRRCWAGDVNSNGTEEGKVQRAFSVYKTTDFYGESGMNRMRACLPGQCGRHFAASPCNTRECTKKNTSYTWIPDVDIPCNAECNCGGNLCSRCVEGFTLLPGSSLCVDCRRAKFKIPFVMFFILELLASVLLIAALLFFNIGLTATLDSWFFFSQVH